MRARGSGRLSNSLAALLVSKISMFGRPALFDVVSQGDSGLFFGFFCLESVGKVQNRLFQSSEVFMAHEYCLGLGALHDDKWLLGGKFIHYLGYVLAQI